MNTFGVVASLIISALFLVWLGRELWLLFKKIKNKKNKPKIKNSEKKEK